MKTPNTTDQIFKEKLEDYASEVPVGLWEAIDNQRSHKKRGFWLWEEKGKWLLLGLLLLTVSGVGYWWTGDGERRTAHGVEIRGNELGNLKGAKMKVEKEIFNSEKTTITAEAKVDELIEKGGRIASENGLTNKKNTLLTEKSKNTPPTKQMPFVKSAIVLKENTSNSSVLETAKGVENAFTNNSISINDKPALSNFSLTNAGSTNEITDLAALESLKLSELIFKGKPDPCYAFNAYDSGKKGPPRFYVDLLASPDYAHRTFTAKNADLNGYATIRDSTESSRLGFSSTIRLSMVLANGLALRSGLAYTQINEQLDLFNGTHTEIQSYEVKDINGNVIDIQLDTIVGRLIKTTYNRFYMVDVPVILGYEIRDRNWTFALNGGAYFNVLFEQKGEFLNPNLTPVTFTSSAEPHYEAYKKTVGMSLFGSVGVHYKISNRFHVTAEPHFRYYMDSFTNQDYPLKQNYWSMGMNVGVRMQLF